MKITCPACSAEYNVDPSRIPADGLNMRCPQCSQSFRVTADGQTQTSDEVSGGTLLDGSGHAIQDEYYVRRHTGKVFGPFDGNAIQLMLQSGKVDGASEVSHDKESWQPILDIPEFANVLSEGSKQTMMGMGSVGGDQDLPAKKAADLPAPKRGGGAPDLPAPKRGGAPPDLPAPKRSSGGGPGLPAPKSGGNSPGLPQPKRNSPGLPAPKGGVDLPAAKGGVDLPAPKGGGGVEGLPVTKDGNLPAAKGSDLPVSRGQAGDNLPAPKGGGLPVPKAGQGGLPVARGGDLPAAKGGDLPVSRDGAQLPAGKGGDQSALPVPKAGGDDLFGRQEMDDDDLFGDDDDDLFGDAGGGDDDLFGSPGGGGGGGDDDLFGAPEEDDLFGGEEEDDLFGSPSEADDDLFAEDDGGAGDDFLGGDAGFSFLDDEPQAAPKDDWGDDLFEESDGDIGVGTESSAGLDDWGDDLLDVPDKPKGQEKSEPAIDADDPFRPASRGLQPKESEPEADSAHVTKDEASDSDRKRAAAIRIAGPILAIAVVAGLGYFAYTNFFTEEQTKTTTTTKSVGPTGLDTAMLKSDNYSDYTILKDAAAEPKEGEEGTWLLAQSMMLTRYPDEKSAERAEKVATTLENAEGGWEALGRGAWEARAGNADAARAYLESLSGESGEVGFFANLVMGIGDIKAVQNEIARSGGPSNPAPTREKTPTQEEAPDEDTGEEPAEGSEAGAEGEDADAVEGEAPPADGEDEEGAEVEEGEEAEAGEAEEAEPESAANYTPLVARARTALDAAQKIDPKSALPHYWKGRLSRLIGEPKRALTQFSKATELAPEHVATHVQLGEVSYEQGNLNDAIETLETVSGELSAKAANSEKARALHYTGLVHVARRKSDLAIEAFTKALSIDSSRSDTLRALAEEYERARKYKEALNFFTTNKNLGEQDPEVMLGIVRSHMGLEQWNQAIATLEEGQRLFPQDARFPYYLGQLFMKRGAFVDARKPLKRAVDIDPSLLTAHATLAQLAWRMDKDIERGEEYIARIVDQADQIDADVATQVAEYYYLSGRRETAEEWYREALDRDPNFWPARLALSKLLLEENRQGEAQKLLERARAEGVEDVRLSAYLADAYRQAKDYDRAIDEINNVIKAYPKNEEYIFIRGRIHFDRGNYDTAQEDFQKAYDLNPRFHDAYFFVGRTAFAREDYANALKIFRHVLDYKPDRGDYRYFMARALESANRKTQALDEYRKATAVDPAYGIENPMVYVYRGRLLSKLNYSREGKADIARALELAPSNVEALLAMGESEFLDRNYDEAIEHYTKALQFEPGRAKAQYRLGMSLLYTDRRNEAAQRLQLAIKHGYEDPEVYKRLGYLYRDLGQRSQALAAFKKFLDRAEKTGNVPVATKREVLGQIERLQ